MYSENKILVKVNPKLLGKVRFRLRTNKYNPKTEKFSSNIAFKKKEIST